MSCLIKHTCKNIEIQQKNTEYHPIYQEIKYRVTDNNT